MSTTRRDFLRQTGALAAGAVGIPFLGCSAPDIAPVAIATDWTGFDGVGLAELVRKGEVSPLELVEDVLRRIEQVNGPLNAVLTSLRP